MSDKDDIMTKEKMYNFIKEHPNVDDQTKESLKEIISIRDRITHRRFNDDDQDKKKAKHILS